MNKIVYFLVLLMLLVACGNSNLDEQNIGELVINGELDIRLDTVLNNLNEPGDLFVTDHSVYYSERNGGESDENGAYKIKVLDEITGETKQVYSSNKKLYSIAVNDSCLFISAGDMDGASVNANLFIYNLNDQSVKQITDSLAEPFEIDADADGNVYVGAIINENIRKPLVKYKAPEYEEFDRELDGSGEILSFDYGSDFIWFSNAGGIAKTQARSTWSVSFINGVTGLLVTQNHIYYSKYEYNLLGRINLFTGENETLLENILRPYRMSYSEDSKALYFIVNDNSKENTSTMLRLVVQNDLVKL